MLNRWPKHYWEGERRRCLKHSTLSSDSAAARLTLVFVPPATPPRNSGSTEIQDLKYLSSSARSNKLSPASQEWVRWPHAHSCQWFCYFFLFTWSWKGESGRTTAALGLVPSINCNTTAAAAVWGRLTDPHLNIWTHHSPALTRVCRKIHLGVPC